LREKGLSCLCAILGKKRLSCFLAILGKKIVLFLCNSGGKLLFCEEGLVRGGRGRGRGREGVVVGCCCVCWIVLFVCVVLCCGVGLFVLWVAVAVQGSSPWQQGMSGFMATWKLYWTLGRGSMTSGDNLLGRKIASKLPSTL
jgi:hypothetical protein